MINAVLTKRFQDDSRADVIREAFPDVNVEAICMAIIKYRGNFMPYPKDIETDVYTFDIDGVFMKGIRELNGIGTDVQLRKQREMISAFLGGN